MVAAMASPASAAGSFFDDNGSVHEADIEGLAEAGVTKGCNPPANSKYCAEGAVTRGEMAAFMNRTLDLPAASRDWFVDDDDSIFEDDINRIAEAGITKGCNPPDNDEYCPTDFVTREQMASFLVRADDDLSGRDPASLHERVVTYDVRSEGASVTDFQVSLLELRAKEALYAEESWNIRHRMLIEQVDSGGDFTLILTDADLVGEQAPGVCSDVWSCTVGDDLYINRDNFFDPPTTWEDRRRVEYQRYVVLHETGHWFDFDDTADGDDPRHYNDDSYCFDLRAPTMKQQSIDTGDCLTNVYPLAFERDCVEEAWLPDTTNQGDGDGDDDDQCPHDPTPR